MGKSRLLAELVRRSARARRRACSCGRVRGLRREHELPGLARRLARRCFGLDPDAPTTESRRVQRRCAAIDPALARARRCWACRSGIELPDTELTATLDAKLRKASLEDLLRDVPARAGGRERRC